jgi:hypothetical protein
MVKCKGNVTIMLFEERNVEGDDSGDDDDDDDDSEIQHSSDNV